MYIGNLTLIIPALYLIVAAVVVLLMGVVAAKNPDKGLDHYIPTQYLAPALMVPGLIWAGWVVAQSLMMTNQVANAIFDHVITPVSAVSLFVVTGGHAQLVVDPAAAIFSFVAIAGTLIVMLLSLEHFGENQIHKAEYYSLLMFATVAASLVAASADLIAIYLSIEFLSLVSYVLAAYAKTDRRSGEAGLKYFLYGAASSAIMLYGMSILFGITGGSTALSAIARHFTLLGAASTGAGFVAILFTLVGLGFKLALVPFQFWAPDTYEGAPTPITAFLSVVSKAAGLAIMLRFLAVVAFPGLVAVSPWYWILVVLSAVSMFYGNLVAIPQRNIKRMLAYSSIAQVGYMMVGILVAQYEIGYRAFANGMGTATSSGSGWGMQGVLIYIAAYLLMNLGVFAVVVAVGKQLKSDDVDSYAGLMKRSPFLAASLAVFFASLAGIPPTAGFLGKFFIFGGAVSVGLLGHPELIVLAVLGVVNSVISVFYYFNVVRLMYFVDPDSKQEVRASLGLKSAVAVTLALTLAIVIFAKPVSDLTSRAAAASDTVYVSAPR